MGDGRRRIFASICARIWPSDTEQQTTTDKPIKVQKNIMSHINGHRHLMGLAWSSAIVKSQRQTTWPLCCCVGRKKWVFHSCDIQIEQFEQHGTGILPIVHVCEHIGPKYYFLRVYRIHRIWAVVTKARAFFCL